MKKIIMIISALLVTMPVLAQTTGENKNDEVKSKDLNHAELLAQITQPAADATNITVIVEKNQTIEEYRERGELVLVKVIPNNGVPYFIDPLESDHINGSGHDLINSGVKPVRWVLKEF